MKLDFQQKDKLKLDEEEQSDEEGEVTQPKQFFSTTQNDYAAPTPYNSRVAGKASTNESPIVEHSYAGYSNCSPEIKEILGSTNRADAMYGYALPTSDVTGDGANVRRTGLPHQPQAPESRTAAGLDSPRNKNPSQTVITTFSGVNHSPIRTVVHGNNGYQAMFNVEYGMRNRKDLVGRGMYVLPADPSTIPAAGMKSSEIRKRAITPAIPASYDGPVDFSKPKFDTNTNGAAQALARSSYALGRSARDNYAGGPNDAFRGSLRSSRGGPTSIAGLQRESNKAKATAWTIPMNERQQSVPANSRSSNQRQQSIPANSRSSNQRQQSTPSKGSVENQRKSAPSPKGPAPRKQSLPATYNSKRSIGGGTSGSVANQTMVSQFVNNQSPPSKSGYMYEETTAVIQGNDSFLSPHCNYYEDSYNSTTSQNPSHSVYDESEQSIQSRSRSVSRDPSIGERSYEINIQADQPASEIEVYVTSAQDEKRTVRNPSAERTVRNPSAERTVRNPSAERTVRNPSAERTVHNSSVGTKGRGKGSHTPVRNNGPREYMSFTSQNTTPATSRESSVSPLSPLRGGRGHSETSNFPNRILMQHNKKIAYERAQYENPIEPPRFPPSLDERMFNKSSVRRMPPRRVEPASGSMRGSEPYNSQGFLSYQDEQTYGAPRHNNELFNEDDPLREEAMENYRREQGTRKVSRSRSPSPASGAMQETIAPGMIQKSYRSDVNQNMVKEIDNVPGYRLDSQQSYYSTQNSQHQSKNQSKRYYNNSYRDGDESLGYTESTTESLSGLLEGQNEHFVSTEFQSKSGKKYSVNIRIRKTQKTPSDYSSQR